jgi:hypothetical protein
VRKPILPRWRSSSWAFPERVPRVSNAIPGGIATKLLTLPGLASALELIGYRKVYHMKENFSRGDHNFWSRAMDARSICRFLGKEIPNEEFPRKDDWTRYKKNVQRGMNETMI